MTHVIRTAALLLIVFFLVGCGMQEPTDLEDVSEEEGQEVTDFVTNYKTEMIAAVNERDTDELVETYFLPDTSFAQTFERYVEDLWKQGVTKNLVSFEVTGVYRDREEGDLLVDATEHVEMNRKDEEKEEVKRSVRYWVVKGADGAYRLYTIIDRTDR